jgi:hypothetical protein
MKLRRIVEDYEARLTPAADAGSAFARAAGKCEHERFEDGDLDFELSVRGIDLPDGITLHIDVDGSPAAFALVERGVCRLKRRRTRGESIPDVRDGTTIEIRLDSRVVLRGVFTAD